LAEEEQAEEGDDGNDEPEDGNQAEEDDEGQSLLTGGDQMDDQNEEGEGQNEVELIPVLLLEPEEAEGQPVYELANTEEEKSNKTEIEAPLAEKRNSPNEEAISKGEQSELDELMHKMLANKQPGMKHLSDRQLTRLVQFVRQLQTLLEANVVERGWWTIDMKIWGEREEAIWAQGHLDKKLYNP
jgi:hypothetical protein